MNIIILINVLMTVKMKKYINMNIIIFVMKIAKMELIMKKKEYALIQVFSNILI